MLLRLLRSTGNVCRKRHYLTSVSAAFPNTSNNRQNFLSFNNSPSRTTTIINRFQYTTKSNNKIDPSVPLVIDGFADLRSLIHFRGLGSKYNDEDVLSKDFLYTHWSAGWKYKGDWKDGKMEGYGKLFFIKGGWVYEGEWKEGKPHGKGVATQTGTSNEYIGHWYRGFRHGKAIYIDESRNKFVGVFILGLKEGQGVMTYADGSSYRGNWLADKYHGAGTYTSVGSNTVYTGHFVKGKMDGTGKLVYANGGSFEGEFRKGLPFTGKGFVELPDGESFRGQLKEGTKVNPREASKIDTPSPCVAQHRVEDGKDHSAPVDTAIAGNGTGISSYKRTRESGQLPVQRIGFVPLRYGGLNSSDWEAGKRTGKGKFIYKNGTILEATWMKGSLHGPVSIKYPDGNKFKGVFRFGNVWHGTGSIKPPVRKIHKEGSWKYGKLVGMGKLCFTFPGIEGLSLVGEFKDSMLFSGYGSFYKVIKKSSTRSATGDEVEGEKEEEEEELEDEGKELEDEGEEEEHTGTMISTGENAGKGEVSSDGGNNGNSTNTYQTTGPVRSTSHRGRVAVLSYTGQIYNFCRHGRGTAYFPHGTYCGSFSNHLFDGYGTFTSSDGSSSYAGEFRNGLFWSGSGVMQTLSESKGVATTYSGTWENGCLVGLGSITRVLVTVEADLDAKPVDQTASQTAEEKQGEEEHTANEVASTSAEGVEPKEVGKEAGTVTGTQSGEVEVDAAWIAHFAPVAGRTPQATKLSALQMEHGATTALDETKKAHLTGVFKDGFLESGFATFTELGSGNEYSGEIVNFQKSGSGTMTFAADKSVYQGKWLNNLQHGEGVLSYPDGTSRHGVWENGTLL
jgi:hypothetical protein